MSDREHAVVLGGSITGLAAAQVLSRRFRRVTVVERDSLGADGAEFRGGVPQGRQLHLLLRRGQDLLDQLFPGFTAQTLAGGAVMVRWGRDLKWYHFGGWKRPNDSKFESLFGTRLLIESVVRERLRHTDNIAILDEAKVEGLVVDNGVARGVKLDGRGELVADLVVDATGRESKAPEWWKAAGLTPPVDQVVNAQLGYSTRVYRRKEHAESWRGIIIHATPPEHTRLGAIIPIEGNRWHVVLAGVNEDYPPTDEAGFNAFVASLASPELAEALDGAEPLGTIYGYRRTANRLRAYEDVKQHLGNFVAVGDAVCAFNPVYAQGMTTGVAGAHLLGECVDATSLDKLAPHFHRRLRRMLRVPWFLATSEDFRYPKTEGRAMNGGIAFMQRCIDHVIRRSVVDRRAYDAFVSIMHMTRGPEALLMPSAIWGALGPAPRV